MSELSKTQYSKEIKAVLTLQTTGAGFNRSEVIDAIKENIPWFAWDELNHRGSDYLYANAIDRNEGLIAITQKGMANNIDWAEGEAWLNIDTCSLNFGVCNFYDQDEFNDYIEDEYITQEMIDNVPEICYDYSDIPFEDIPRLQTDIASLDVWKDAEGNLYTKIG